jgi:hypothetical protein
MKTQTKSLPSRLAVLMVGAVMFGLASQSAMAAPIGTPSGTSIANIATLSYSVGSTAQANIGSSPTGNTSGAGTPTTFLVDNKVNLTVVNSGAVTTVVAGQAVATTTFTVNNLGNTSQDFLLAVANLTTSTANPYAAPAVTDNFDGTGCSVTNVAGAGTYTAGDTHINALASGSTATVTVTCAIPAAQANSSLAVVSLTATARTDDGANTMGGALTNGSGSANTAGVDIVFADGAGSDDAANAGNYSDRSAYYVQTATLSVTKTVAPLCDPVTGSTNPHNIPGGMVRWTITIANTGSASATLATIADALDANTALDPDLITGAGAGSVCEFAAAGAGTPTSANGNSVAISMNGAVTRPMAGTAAGAAAQISYFTGAADTDGVTGAAINFGTAFPAGGSYAAGEMKAGETVTIYYNVGIN